MEQTLLNAWILLGLLLGGGLLLVNMPGGSGYDAFDWQGFLPIRHRADWVRSSPKLLPRGKIPTAIGAILVIASLLALYLFG